MWHKLSQTILRIRDFFHQSSSLSWPSIVKLLYIRRQRTVHLKESVFIIKNHASSSLLCHLPWSGTPPWRPQELARQLVCLAGYWPQADGWREEWILMSLDQGVWHDKSHGVSSGCSGNNWSQVDLWWNCDQDVYYPVDHDDIVVV